MDTEAGIVLAQAAILPKSTLKTNIAAWLLVMLKDHNLHGYEIRKELKSRFDVTSDAGSVYRTLRVLEREGYISSWWDSKEQGPARRLYALTDRGHHVLRIWNAALEQYRARLNAFFDLYSGYRRTAGE